MSKLIDELKEEHTRITTTLNKVEKIGAFSKKGQEVLLSAKSTLLSHLKKEDEQLYPVLRESAKKDTALKKTLDMFAKDMEKISKSVLEFFDKYSEGGSGMEFAKDYGRFFAALSSRIRREEDILYAKYNEITP